MQLNVYAFRWNGAIFHASVARGMSVGAEEREVYQQVSFSTTFL